MGISEGNLKRVAACEVKIKILTNRTERKMFRALTILVLASSLSSVCYSASEHRHLRSVLGAFLEPNRPPVARTSITSSSQQTTTCTTGCSKKISIVDSDQQEYALPENDRYSVSEQEFTALRIEYIKNQILKKLRLKEKPQVSGAVLPQPVTENNYLMQRGLDNALHSKYSDDFYGRTTQAIIFPYEDEAKCVRKIRNPSACIPFQMPDDIAATDVRTAELWFYKEPDNLDTHNQTFVISEVAHWDTNKSFQKNKPIAIQETNLTEGWLKIDVTYVIKNWIMYQDSPTHAISVACKTCGMDIYKSPISFKSSLKPFLVIHTHTQNRVGPITRTKRSVNCSPDSTECCRESLYVSFAEIGWDDWIIEPAGYNAYFCRGTCATAAALTLSASQHNAILHKIMFGSHRNAQTRLELTPCCAATHFKPLQLLFTDSNKTITSKILSNMIVDSCGCM